MPTPTEMDKQPDANFAGVTKPQNAKPAEEQENMNARHAMMASCSIVEDVPHLQW